MQAATKVSTASEALLGSHPPAIVIVFGLLALAACHNERCGMWMWEHGQRTLDMGQRTADKG